MLITITCICWYAKSYSHWCIIVRRHDIIDHQASATCTLIKTFDFQVIHWSIKYQNDTIYIRIFFMISIILELKFAENGGCYTPKNKSHICIV